MWPKLCTKPTLIPVLNKHITPESSDDRDSWRVAPKSFVLAHAVQLLDITAYPHRFPTPPTIGGGTDESVANLFSMEDLYRAICMFYQLNSRRLGRTAWIGRTPGTKKATTLRFPGYVNHDLMHLADVPEKDDNPLSVARFSQCGEIGGSICSTRAGRARRRDYVRQQQEEDKHRDGLQRHEVPPDPTEP
ncbi:hypothetical protein FPOA_06823 [Fusarium poae]|uniref:Uncharacterized protein n=1 Tax=Fusarium poae TaxID=36050 RepID=A0A1B8AJL3_FUSPO|nr:hypothetical protein FPOA_06823 [Fusarium poae]